MDPQGDGAPQHPGRAERGPFQQQPARSVGLMVDNGRYIVLAYLDGFIKQLGTGKNRFCWDKVMECEHFIHGIILVFVDASGRSF